MRYLQPFWRGHIFLSPYCKINLMKNQCTIQFPIWCSGQQSGLSPYRPGFKSRTLNHQNNSFSQQVRTILVVTKYNFFFSTVYEKRIPMPQLKKLNTFWTEICVDAQDTDPFMMLLSLLQLMHQTASGYVHILYRQISKTPHPPTRPYYISCTHSFRHFCYFWIGRMSNMNLKVFVSFQQFSS